MSPPSRRERRDSVSELQAHFTFVHGLPHMSHGHHRSRTLALSSTTEKCTCTQRQLPAAEFRNSLRLRRLLTVCQKCLQSIGVKLSECTLREVERCCRGNVQECRGAWASCKLPNTPCLPQRSLTLPLLSYRSRELLVHACSVSFWT